MSIEDENFSINYSRLDSLKDISFRIFLILGKFCFYNLPLVVSCKSIDDVIVLFLEKNEGALLEDVFHRDSLFETSLKNTVTDFRYQELFIGTLRGILQKRKIKLLVRGALFNNLDFESSSEVRKNEVRRRLYINIPNWYFHALVALARTRNLYEYSTLNSLTGRGVIAVLEGQESLVLSLLSEAETHYTPIPDNLVQEIFKKRLFHEKERIGIHESCELNFSEWTLINPYRPPPGKNSLVPYASTILPCQYIHESTHKTSLMRVGLLSYLKDFRNRYAGDAPELFLNWYKKYFTDLINKTLSEEESKYNPYHYPYVKKTFCRDEKGEIFSTETLYDLTKARNDFSGDIDTFYYHPLLGHISLKHLPREIRNLPISTGDKLERYLKEDWEGYKRVLIKDAEEILSFM